MVRKYRSIQDQLHKSKLRERAFFDCWIPSGVFNPVSLLHSQKHGYFSEGIDQDQTAKNVQSDLDVYPLLVYKAYKIKYFLLLC